MKKKITCCKDSGPDCKSLLSEANAIVLPCSNLKTFVGGSESNFVNPESLLFIIRLGGVSLKEILAFKISN